MPSQIRRAAPASRCTASILLEHIDALSMLGRRSAPGPSQCLPIVRLRIQRSNGPAGRLTVTRQKPVELSGECIAVTRAIGRRPTRIDSRAAQLRHHFTHRQAFLDIFTAKPAAARVEHMRAFVQGGSGKRYVRGNHQITGGRQFDDAGIGSVETRRHLNRLDEGGRRCAQILVRDQRHSYFDAARGPEQHVLDNSGTGIGINKHVHDDNSVA